VLVAVIVREVGPLLVNFLVIGRSGTAMAAELASMRARREVELLEAQGLDTMGYLVLPRVTGMVVSIFGLTIILIAAALFSGFMFALALGVVTTDVSVLAGSVLGAVEPVDVLNLLAKTLVPSLITGSICCVEGLTIGGAVTEIPQAVTRAVVKSIAAVLMVSVVVSVLTYV
jgi:phospholipid/cholesterol/gamma-HCH transport system permease protein